MKQESPRCSEEECQRKSEHFIFMNMDQLSAQIEQCEGCNKALETKNARTAQTYQLIALIWAEKHNETTGKLR